MGTICQTCGDEGFVEALVYCDSCKIGAVHRYCCGITPVPIDDYITWFCSECDEIDTGSDCKEVEHYELQDTSNVGSVEVSSSPPVIETMEESERREISGSDKSNELTGLVGNEASVSEARAGASVLEKSEKKKKKKRKSTNHSLLTATNVETVEVSKKRDGSETRKSDELTCLVSSELAFLEKSEKKKKLNKKGNEESGNHSLLVLEAEGNGLQDTTSTEPMKESKKHKTSDSRESEELNGLVRNGVFVLEKSEKKKKKKTNKEKKKNEESSHHTSPVLAVQDTTNAEPAKEQESSASRKPHELAGLAINEESVSEGGNSSTLADHNHCTTSKKRRLSSGNIRVTSENTQLAAENSSCKEAELNMYQTKDGLISTIFNSPPLNNDRAQPIYVPIWRGSISVKQGNIDGLVAHLSNLACPNVHEKARSLHARLSAEMFPRLEIWPESFLKNGPPTDERIALYFFPSRDSNYEKVYYSLVLEMKNNDLAMRCVLDNVELLLFTSYQLPMDCWKFHSKEYLWGTFRRRKTFDISQ